MKSPVHAMSHMKWLLLIPLSILWGGSFFFVGGIAAHLFTGNAKMTRRTMTGFGL